MKKLHCSLLALSLMVGASSSAVAGLLSCPGTLATTDREFTIDIAGTASCLATDSGNLNGNNDAVNALGYITLDTSNDDITGLAPFNWLTITGAGTTQGTFSFVAPSGFNNFVLALKSGEGQLDPDWAAFLLPDGITSGNWSISDSQTLSHANLYGQDPPSTVPEPSSIALLGIAFAGLGVTRLRKKA